MWMPRPAHREIRSVDRLLSIVRNPTSIAAVAAATAIWVAPRPADAAALLTFSDNDASPVAGAVAPGGTVSLTTRLTIGNEQVTGVDYQLRTTGAASGHLRIASRSLTGSPLDDPFFTDAEVAAQPASLLNPSSDLDAGASLSDVLSPLGAGTHLVANFGIAVDPTTPLGIYTVETFSAAGLGFVGPAPSFTDQPFTQHASYQLVVRTFDGDANLNGSVGPEDFNILASHFGQTGQAWSTGDFDFDGTVGPGDFNLLASNFGKSSVSPGLAADPSVLQPFAASLPEPTAAALLGIGAAASFLRRRSRR